MVKRFDTNLLGVGVGYLLAVVKRFDRNSLGLFQDLSLRFGTNYLELFQDMFCNGEAVRHKLPRLCDVRYVQNHTLGISRVLRITLQRTSVSPARHSYPYPKLV